MRKMGFAYAKTKSQISCAIIQSFKLLAFSCGYTGRFVSNRVGNAKDQFSHIIADMRLSAIMRQLL